MKALYSKYAEHKTDVELLKWEFEFAPERAEVLARHIDVMERERQEVEKMEAEMRDAEQM